MRSLVEKKAGEFLTLAELSEVTKGSLLAGSPELRPQGISTDTRTLIHGQAFLALSGERFDGNEFWVQALEKGASALILSRVGGGVLERAKTLGVGVIEVKDSLWALGEIARAWRKKHRVRLMGITGSNGKTTTKEMVASILAKGGEVLKNEGNLNNRIGVPLTLLRLNRSHSRVVLEMGTNEPGEIRRLCEIASPQIGLITQIGPAHLERLGSLEGVAREKGALFEALAGDGIAVVNLDDPWIKRLASKICARKISYGVTPGAMVWAHQMDPFCPQGAKMRVRLAGEEITARFPAHGTPVLMCGLAAIGAAWAMGASLQEIVEGLESFRPQWGRLNVWELKNGTTLIDDSYNANPASMRAALELLCRGGEGRKVAILGEMKELGSATIFAHRELGREAARMGVEVLIAVGPWAHEVVRGAREEAKGVEMGLFELQTCDEAAGCAKELLKPGDRVLVKGSRGAAMERISEALRAWGQGEG